MHCHRTQIAEVDLLNCYSKLYQEIVFAPCPCLTHETPQMMMMMRYSSTKNMRTAQLTWWLLQRTECDTIIDNDVDSII